MTDVYKRQSQLHVGRVVAVRDERVGVAVLHRAQGVVDGGVVGVVLFHEIEVSALDKDVGGLGGDDLLDVDGIGAVSYTHLLLFTERDAALLAEIIPTQQRMPFREKCDRVATIYKLSPREHEVLDLLARGRDSAAIQERLSLSASTVQTHRMHIYQKLQIHSRQELLDVIEAQEVDRRG